MNISTRSRIARSAAIAVTASTIAVTTTVATQATANPAPESERPCFIVQPRWNTAVDGPAPTCATPARHRTAGDQPASTSVATIADCIDPAHRPVVKTCPYPIKSGDQFAQYFERQHVEVERGRARVRP